MTRARLSRRQMLLGGVAGGAAAAFAGTGALTRLARAAVGLQPAEHYYVFCYFSGGWDILLSLDPRDPATFNASTAATTLIDPAYDKLSVTDGQLVETDAGITFGPAIGKLAKHAKKLALVRGMSHDTLTHEAGRRRFLTGRPPSGLQARGSSTATWLAATLGEAQPIPSIAMRVESFNVDQPSWATGLGVTSVEDLVQVLRPSEPAVAAVVRQQLDELMVNTSSCDDAQSSAFWQASETARERAREMVTLELDALFDFMAPTPEMEALREAYDLSTATDAKSTPRAQAALAAQALKGGVARVVSIEAASGLDTHYGDWSSAQATRQLEGFDAVSRLITDLANSEYHDTGHAWLDHTTIIGFSEFSRSPALNANGGRDHGLVNTCFLAGGGIKGGQVIGRSTDVGLLPTTTNLVTGETDPEGEVIKPEHVLRALLHDAGRPEDDADLRVEPLLALLKHP